MNFNKTTRTTNYVITPAQKCAKMSSAHSQPCESWCNLRDFDASATTPHNKFKVKKKKPEISLTSSPHSKCCTNALELQRSPVSTPSYNFCNKHTMPEQFCAKAPVLQCPSVNYSWTRMRNITRARSYHCAFFLERWVTKADPTLPLQSNFGRTTKVPLAQCYAA